MPKKMRLILLVGLLVIIWGIDVVSQSISDVMGPDYPGMIEYRSTGREGQLTVLGKEYQLSPGVLKAVEHVEAWREQLAGFLD
ncbi:MAG: hypothetical protein GX750_05785 [Clostridia bacterium]|nr:hypothetical protein [Clostridia bacterium]